jgi:hypothetical protein
MPKSLRIIAALLFVTAELLIPTAMAGEAVPSPGTMPQIVAFDNEDFLGDHTHIFGDMKDLGKWGNSISSMVILSGTYADVTKHGLKNNSISSVHLAKPAGGATR